MDGPSLYNSSLDNSSDSLLADSLLTESSLTDNAFLNLVHIRILEIMEELTRLEKLILEAKLKAKKVKDGGQLSQGMDNL